MLRLEVSIWVFASVSVVLPIGDIHSPPAVLA